MCSGGAIQQTDEALQKSQAAMTNTLNQDYSTTFAEQQQVLNQQRARMSAIAANPMGYSPAQLHTATTSINENTSRAAKQAIGSAAAYAAAHGGSAGDVGGGPISQAVGSIASDAAQSKAGQLAALSNANEGMKQQNFWNAISGLNSVGSELGGAGGTAIGGAGSAAGSSVNAGSGALAAKESGFQEFGSVLSGIGGLATGVLSPWAGKACWVAAAIYGGWEDPRTNLVRDYIFGPFAETWYGSRLAGLYSRYGKTLAKSRMVVRLLTPLFNIALRKAQKVNHGR